MGKHGLLANNEERKLPGGIDAERRMDERYLKDVKFKFRPNYTKEHILDKGIETISSRLNELKLGEKKGVLSLSLT